MVFSSIMFLFLFLPCVVFMYYLLIGKNRKRQNYFLFAASILFYAAGEPVFVLVMLLSIAANWQFALLIDKNRRGGLTALWVAIAFNLGLIFVFKYLSFSVDNLNLLFGTSLYAPQILLPIGISFFTFQSISYVVDVYRGKGQAQRNLFYVGLYIAFFPQLIAGPIVRYETVADQIANRKESFDEFSEGVCRFIIGLSKKVLIANQLATISYITFQRGGGELPIVFAWLGAIAFTFQIYFDFSGYSDMAIGLGKMFGFRFLENFNYPYAAKSVSEFWRRWHMSLGQWFKDYVYFPMGGSRVGRFRLIGNLFVVWLLTGVWHGANWTFISWGLLYFVFIVLEKITGFEKSAIPDWLKRAYTMLLVTLGWVIFNSESIGDASSYIKSMFGLNGNAWIDDLTLFYVQEYQWFFLAALMFSAPVSKLISEKLKTDKKIAWGYPIGMLVVFTISVSYIVKGSYNPFIYFNF